MPLCNNCGQPVGFLSHECLKGEDGLTRCVELAEARNGLLAVVGDDRIEEVFAVYLECRKVTRAHHENLVGQFQEGELTPTEFARQINAEIHTDTKPLAEIMGAEAYEEWSSFRPDVEAVIVDPIWVEEVLMPSKNTDKLPTGWRLIKGGGTMSRPHRCIECGEPHDGTHPKCGDCIIDPVIRRYAQERASEPIEPPKAAPRTARDRLLDRVRGLARIWTEEDPVPQSYLEELDTMERDMAAMGAFMDADFNRFRRDLVNLNRHRAFSAMLEIEAALKAVEPPL